MKILGVISEKNIFTFYVTLFLPRITYNVVKRIFEANFDMLQVFK